MNEKAKEDFIAAILNHLSKYKGLYIWADNAPHIVHANLILDNISLGIVNENKIKI